jgi:hypothetical protein
MKKNVLIIVFLFTCAGLNAQIFKPLDQMSDVERSYFLAERFWGGFPFHDTMSLHRQDFHGAVERYLQAIQLADLQTIQRSLVETIKKADTNERMYRYFVETFDLYLNSEWTGMRDEQWIEPVWHQMLKSRWSTFADSAKINFFLKLADRNRVGTSAPDLDFITIHGQKGKLSEIDAELVMLFFYAPGCAECVRTLGWIVQDSAYQELLDAGVLQVLAFYPEKDMNVFRTYRGNIPNTWINARDPDGMSQLEEEEKYLMRGAPTMYLLDKNKNIILRDARIDQLFNEFAKTRDKRLRN